MKSLVVIFYILGSILKLYAQNRYFLLIAEKNNSWRE